VEVVVKLNGLL